MFKKILLVASPTKTGERAADTAFALAKQSRAELFIFHACGIESHGWGEIEHFIPSGKVADIEAGIHRFYRPRLQRFDVQDYTVTVVPGMPHSEILRFARRKAVDLIIMGPHERALDKDMPARWGMAGSSLERVSQRARCPVMVVSDKVPKVWTEAAVSDRRDFSILVVDDERVLRDSLREWLEDENYTVDTAATGLEALDKLAEKPFHLMLTDIKMPGMDGVELLRSAHKSFPHVKVIMMTAYATVETAVEALKMGALDYLLKPFDPEIMVAKIFDLYQHFEAARSVRVTFSNVVFATDFSRQADQAFQFATQMAHFHKAKLHIFHVLPIVESQGIVTIDQVGIEAHIKAALERMQKRYGGKLEGIPEYAFESWEGTPYVEILKYARWRHADLIIMAHHSTERDAEKAFLGSNVVRVALSATCPTISINR